MAQKQQQIQPIPAKVFAALTAEFDEQCKCLGELDALSQRQAAVIDQGDGTDLLALMSERQQVIDDIARVNLRIEPLKRTWDELLSAADAAHRVEIERRVAAMTSMLHAVRDRDDADRRTLEARRDEIRQELQRLESSKRAVGAYGQPAQSAVRQDQRA